MNTIVFIRNTNINKSVTWFHIPPIAKTILSCVANY